jgi:NADPH-dependent ferric siderophore reductase
VEVHRSVRISPNVQRVTFTGAALADFALGSPGGHIKLFLPPAGAAAPALPVPGPDGPQLPEGAVPPVVRTYTPRRWDPATGELDVDVVLHGDGPASTWAAAAGPGDRAGVAGPGRGYDPGPDAPWFVVAGDETALPAIAAIVAALPAGRPATVLVEIPEAADAQPLPSPAAVTSRWLVRGTEEAGAPMEAAIRALELPDAAGRAWVAGEAAVIRRLRRHLLEDRGLDGASIVTRGYWKRGASNHPDHDFGDD